MDSCLAAKLATDDDDLGAGSSLEAKSAEMERRRELLWRAASGRFSAHRGGATIFSGGFRLPEFTSAFDADADAEVPLRELVPGERCTLRLGEDAAEVVFTLVGGMGRRGVRDAGGGERTAVAASTSAQDPVGDDEARTLALATALRYLALDPRHTRFGPLYYAGTAEPAFWSAVVAFCATGSTLPAFVPDDGALTGGHGLARAPLWWVRTRTYWDSVLSRSRDSGGRDVDCLFSTATAGDGPAFKCPLPGCTLRHAPRHLAADSDDDEPAD